MVGNSEPALVFPFVDTGHVVHYWQEMCAELLECFCFYSISVSAVQL